MIEEFYTTRSACLFFSILGFIVASGFYLTFLFNIHHQIEAIPWSLLVFYFKKFVKINYENLLKKLVYNSYLDQMFYGRCQLLVQRLLVL